ncbi:MAG: hypothetical protein K9H64_01660 [Bacteroidales bacterium]|nr:hypothetical protein [Bacteroidales bacterium]MCF8454611.1 hypothetical protein [Bacteroidales bacterium]
MRSKFDAPYIGLLVGIIVPLIGLFVFYKYNFQTLDFREFIDHVIRINRIPQLLSLSVIANLAVFYLFIWKKFYYSARGVIGATFIYVLVVLILKYFV